MSDILEHESALNNILDIQDIQHSIRVARYAVNFAKVLGLNDLDIEQLKIAAIWHDIGKSKISKEILNKKGKLSDVEMKIIKKHPTYSEEYLLSYSSLSKSAIIARCHHERWDGSGYPDGIKGEGIPYLARILSIVDVYDALTADRPYRDKNFAPKEALKIIQEGKYNQFDPYLVSIFTNYFVQIIGNYGQYDSKCQVAKTKLEIVGG